MIALSSLKMTTAIAGALLLLAACTAGSSGPDGGVAGTTGSALPPPSSSDSAAAGALPPPSSSDAAAGSLPVVPSEPLPAAPSTGEAPAAETAGEAVIIKGPDGTSWEARSTKDEEAYRADIDDCYRYATAQTRHDAQIIDDRNAGIDTLTSQSRYSALRRRVDEFDLRNRRTALMSSCMESKGYARADTVLPRLEF